MKELSKDLKAELTRLGADIIGIGDITELQPEIRKNMGCGIAVAVAIDPDTVRGIANGPTEKYHEAYMRLNEKLDSIVKGGEAFLHKKGYEAIAQTSENIAANETDYNTTLPHKTIATRAGIGWIGKSALLVTEKFGSAVRISAILTNAPLEVDSPVNEARCGSCSVCTKACPGQAVTGTNWSIQSKREDYFDPVKCRRMARKLAKELLDIEKTLCGKCIYVCPYTQKYLLRG